ncbi:MAG: cupin domain-containing protein [Thioalkalispiraceae bacterium]|jgi:quercetin dioxygenase-like cupin family protein
MPGRTPDIVRWSVDKDGELTEQNMADKLTSLGYRVNRYIYPPGTYFPAHAHNVDKIDAVLAGQFKICMQDREHILEAGDWIEVPHGVIHSAEVIGDQPVLSLDAIKLT